MLRPLFGGCDLGLTSAGPFWRPIHQVRFRRELPPPPSWWVSWASRVQIDFTDQDWCGDLFCGDVGIYPYLSNSSENFCGDLSGE